MNSRLLLAPRSGPGVCVDCFTFTEPGYSRCLACQRTGRHLSAMSPIAYSVAGGSLHRAIASYKRDVDPSVEPAVRWLAGLLGTFLPAHEDCLAVVSGVEGFDLVTTVPSQDVGRENGHPLKRIVGSLVPATRDRYQPLLRRTSVQVEARSFHPERFVALTRIDGARVLLIDDMWTSGASAQSAAASLRRAGAVAVAAVVIGRHLNRDWSQNALRLKTVAAPLDFTACALCVGSGRGASLMPVSGLQHSGKEWKT